MSRKDNRPSHITVEDFFNRHKDLLQLELLSDNGGLKRKIQEPVPNRPGLVLSGYVQYFAWRRIQVIGAADRTYLMSLKKKERAERFRLLCSKKIPCIIMSRGKKLSPELLAIAKEKKISVLVSPMITMSFVNQATALLALDFAPTINEHGSMVDVSGIGVFIRGKSGIGKSESVLGLIERGGSLVADDVVHFKEEGGRITGTSLEEGRFHMEVRGIGIINIPALFGVRSMRLIKRLDLVVTLKREENLNDVDRLGMEEMKTEILGQEVSHVEIPVAAGRDLSRLVHVAALNQKLRKYGHNAAIDFTDNIARLMKERGMQ